MEEDTYRWQQVDQLRAQVARLEAANAAKDAALRGLCRGHNVRGSDGPCDCVGCRALSDGGEGWLPPEVREQALRDLTAPAACYHALSGHPGPFRECEYPACTKPRAALDVLKGGNP